MKKSGFTLVEMLIVVVIIGILASALFPKITGYMERTRDLKRQTDLHTIAAAIEIYRNTHGEMPTRTMTKKEQQLNETGRHFHHKIAWYASALQNALGDYISSIPTDPSKKTMVNIYHLMTFNNSSDDNRKLAEVRFWKDLKGGTLYKPWEYLYYITRWTSVEQRSESIIDSAGVLVAKVETPEYANYIISSPREKSANGGTWMIPSWYYRNGKYFVAPWLETKEIKLCSSVEKASKEHPLTSRIEDGKACYYTSEDQLYYVYKIE